MNRNAIRAVPWPELRADLADAAARGILGDALRARRIQTARAAIEELAVAVDAGVIVRLSPADIALLLQRGRACGVEDSARAIASGCVLRQEAAVG